MKDSTVSRVRLPIDDVVDRVYEEIMRNPWHVLYVLELLSNQTEFVVRGVLAKHRAERGSA